MRDTEMVHGGRAIKQKPDVALANAIRFFERVDATVFVKVIEICIDLFRVIRDVGGRWITYRHSEASSSPLDTNLRMGPLIFRERPRSALSCIDR